MIIHKATIALIGSLVLSCYGCVSHPGKSSQSEADPRADFARGIGIMRASATAEGRTAGAIWVQRAADQNLAIAQARLGLMYLSGDGVKQNTSLALTWTRKAAERGAPAAQLLLGRLYSAGGNLVPLDNAEAYYWDSIAAKPVVSNVYIFNISQIRDVARKRAQTVSRVLTAAQRADIDQRVAAWTPIPSVPYSGVVNISDP